MKFTYYFILSTLLSLVITSCSKDAETTPPPAPEVPTIGKTYTPAGGIVFYLDGSGQHGLVAAPGDEPYAAPWGCEYTWTNASGTAQGTGLQNSDSIVGACSTSGIAARLCKGETVSGKSDWYMPSKDELNMMRNTLYLNGIGYFQEGFYWSSTEGDSLNGWFQVFKNGYQDKYPKRFQFFVRAIRNF